MEKQRKRKGEKDPERHPGTKKRWWGETQSQGPCRQQAGVQGVRVCDRHIRRREKRRQRVWWETALVEKLVSGSGHKSNK